MTLLNYEFKDKSLLDLALTQSGADSSSNNERLEFVGDRVLGLVVANLLYDMFPSESEGELARRFAVLVSTETLADVALKLELDKKIRRGHMTGGKIRHILANGMEAVIGAIYIDSDFDSVKKIISEIWSDLGAADIIPPKDSKTSLQEFVQKQDSGALPEYTVIDETGSAHSPVFKVSVSALGESATGKGPSKKEASMAAAEELLKLLAI